MANDLIFKIADRQEEFDQIHRLNYQTFVREIPQHRPNPSGILVDKFHHQNTYLIGLKGEELAAMLAVRATRPFSLDQKLEDLDAHLPPHTRPCEIRLLSVKSRYRHGRIFRDLMAETVRYCVSKGYDYALISGVLGQQKLYRHLGFVPFGPVVGKGTARFQPMYLTPEANAKTGMPLIRLSDDQNTHRPVSFLPGPVEISAEVQAAFAKPPISHRCAEFLNLHSETKSRLCRLANARHVEILAGSGTLANNAIAAQLSLLDGRGLILSNAEFGERLIGCAACFGLEFNTLSLEWGMPFHANEIAAILSHDRNIKWLWAVHCETSTGMLNDADMLKRLCREHGTLLCLDCISSIGAVPVDTEGVYLASAVSGKGLCALPGLSMVFHNHDLQPSKRNLPPYLDLALYAEKNGVPFTSSSNLLAALHAALQRIDVKSQMRYAAQLSQITRRKLRSIGLKTVCPPENSCPAVITIALPSTIDARLLAEKLAAAGYLISYASEYLTERNWCQICLYARPAKSTLRNLLNRIEEILRPEFL